MKTTPPPSRLRLGLLLLESLDAVRTETPVTQESLRDHLVALCEAHECGLTEEETTQAVQRCWERLEKEHPAWLTSPQGQNWKAELEIWQHRGRQQLARERTTWTTTPEAHAWGEQLRSWQRLGRQQLQDQQSITPETLPVPSSGENEIFTEPLGPDTVWWTQGQRPTTLAELNAQRAIWEAQVKQWDRRIATPLPTSMQRSWCRFRGFMVGLLAGCLAGGLSQFLHHPAVAAALPWVGLLVGGFLGELRVHGPEAERDTALLCRDHLKDQLRRHTIAEEGVDIRPHDRELWQKTPDSAALLTQFKLQGGGPLLVKDVELLNAAMGAALYRDFTAQQDRQARLYRLRSTPSGSTYDLGF